MKGLNTYAERFLELPVEIGFAKNLNEATALSFIEPLGLAHIGLFPDKGIQSEPLHVSHIQESEDTDTSKRKTYRPVSDTNNKTSGPNKTLLLLLAAALLFTVIAVAYRWYQNSNQAMLFS